jgi:hypothetical protein
MKTRANHYTNPMKMKYPITILFLLLSISIFSQREIIYDLDSYKQVIFKRSELILTPAGSFSGDDQVNVDGEDANFLVNLNAGIQHRKYINSQDEQFTLYQSANIKFAEGYRIFGRRNLTKRKYTENRYLKTGYNVTTEYDRLKNQNTGVKNNSQDAELIGNFGLGFGRIEYVNHAWSAVQILQALENRSLLQRIPSHDEITDFANKIGEVRTSRILDFRLRDIAILETIVEYLIDNQLIDNLSTTAILIIEDTFEYDQIAARSSGSRLEFSLEPQASYDNKVNSFLYNKLFTIGSEGRITHTTYKNIDVKWMQTITYEAHLRYTNFYQYAIDPQGENSTSKNATAGLNFNYSYAYLPNRRNNLNFNLSSGIYMNASFLENQSTQFSSARLSLILSSIYNYYLSPATQLVVSGALSYFDQNFQSGDFQPSIIGNMSFTLVHAIY